MDQLKKLMDMLPSHPVMDGIKAETLASMDKIQEGKGPMGMFDGKQEKEDMPEYSKFLKTGRAGKAGMIGMFGRFNQGKDK